MKKVFLLSILFFLALPLVSAINLSSCGSILQGGKSYNITQNLTFSDTYCFNIQEGNIVIEGNNFTIIPTSMPFQIFSTGGVPVSNITINNLRIENLSLLNVTGYPSFVFYALYPLTNLYFNNLYVNLSWSDLSVAMFFFAGCDNISISNSYVRSNNLLNFDIFFRDPVNYTINFTNLNSRIYTNNSVIVLNGGGSSLVTTPILPIFGNNSVFSLILGGASFSQFLTVWNPGVYIKLSAQIYKTFDANNLQFFPANFLECSRLMLYYIFRQPGSLVENGGMPQ